MCQYGPFSGPFSCATIGGMAMITVVGNLNCDISARLAQDDIREENRVAAYALGIGGTAANTAIHLARLGAEVALAGAVGKDLLGDFLFTQLAGEGISTRAIVRRDVPTGLCFAAVTPDAQRLLFTHRGANEQPLPPLSTAAPFVHFAGIRPALLLPLLEPLAAETVITYCPGALATREHPEEVLALVPRLRHLFLNEPEADLLARCGTLPDTITVITHGALGAEVKGGAMASPPSVDAVDTTGAGDAFNAGFLCALLRDAPAETALALGNALGALISSRHGATPAWRIAELQPLLAHSPEALPLLEDVAGESAPSLTFPRALL